MIITLIACAYGMGFLAAIPVGATHLEIGRRSINGYLASALAVVLGSTVSDLLYGAIALFGLAAYLQKPKVMAGFEVVSAVLCVVLGLWVIREARTSATTANPVSEHLRHRHTAFATGFFLAVTNPLMIIWWLIGLGLLENLGAVAQDDKLHRVIFLVAGDLGIVSYLALLAVFVYKVKRFCTDRTIRRISFGFGVALLVFAGYFAIHSTSVFLR